MEDTPPHAVAAAAGDLADDIKAAAIVAFTSSGTTAARIARRRPQVPIIAVTPNEQVSRQLCLLWGAHSVRSPDVHNCEGMVEEALAQAKREGFAETNQTIVVVAGIPFGYAGTTNNLRITEVK